MTSIKKHNIFLSIVIGINIVAYVLLLIFAKNNCIVCTIVCSSINIVCFVLIIIGSLTAKAKSGLFDLVTIVSDAVVTILLIFAFVMLLRMIN